MTDRMNKEETTVFSQSGACPNYEMQATKSL
jgi:hypothetical protein